MFQQAMQSHLGAPFLGGMRSDAPTYLRTCRLDVERPQNLLHVLGSSLEANLDR